MDGVCEQTKRRGTLTSRIWRILVPASILDTLNNEERHRLEGIWLELGSSDTKDWRGIEQTKNE